MALKYNADAFATPSDEAGNLKILIASTPKTGNIWLGAMLSFVYGIPHQELKPEFSGDDLDALGPCWVAHQHVYPSTHLLRLLKDRGVVVISICRHPADVLVSLKNYLARFPEKAEETMLASRMLEDGDVFGAASLHYARKHFAVHVSISLAWIRLGVAHLRFEDLRADPVEALTRLTSAIVPVEFNRVRAAIVLTSLDRLRRRHAEVSGHFRKGTTGQWRDVLPPEILDVFRNEAPYPAILKALGYRMDSRSGPKARFNLEDLDPFKGAASFDNGVPIADAVAQLFLLHLPGAVERWPEPVATAGDESFFSWLNAPCDADSDSQKSGLLITNLAHQLHLLRPDLQDSFADIFGVDRLDFVNWFILHAPVEFGLDSAFINPVFTRLAQSPQIILPPPDSGPPDPETV